MGLLDWFRRKQSDEPDVLPLPSIQKEPVVWCKAVSIDDTGLLAVSRRGHESRLDFNGLDRVAIRTTDEGPWDVDVYWSLVAGTQEYLVPQGAPGEAELFDRLLKLPQFDCQVMIKAMTSTDNAEFECWRRQLDDPDSHASDTNSPD